MTRRWRLDASGIVRHPARWVWEERVSAVLTARCPLLSSTSCWCCPVAPLRRDGCLAVAWNEHRRSKTRWHGQPRKLRDRRVSLDTLTSKINVAQDDAFPSGLPLAAWRSWSEIVAFVVRRELPRCRMSSTSLKQTAFRGLWGTSKNAGKRPWAIASLLWSRLLAHYDAA